MIIATGTSRYDVHWKNVSISWQELLQKCRHPIRTSETVKEYREMQKSQDKDDIKDHGGFVGGELSSDGHRRKSEILNRTLLTFDLDNATPELISGLEQITDFNWCCYSTHKHTPEHPRLRVLIPLSKPIPPEQYEAVVRKLSEQYHWMNAIDPRSFSVAQLMYWPTVSKDGIFYFHEYTEENNTLDAGKFLLTSYEDWQDRRQWPVARGEHIRTSVITAGRPRKDPRNGDSIPACFCQCYTIPEAIEKFLSDVYEPTGDPARFKLIESSSTAGLQTFGGENNDLFCCSWHANDPVNQEQTNQTVDAFNLVRIHKFGFLDNLEETYSKLSTRPSYEAMVKYTEGLPEISKLLFKQKNILPAMQEYLSKTKERTTPDA